MTEAIEIALGFVESKSVREHMKGYLSQEKFSLSHYLCSIICHARASLEEKATALDKIAKLLPPVEGDTLLPPQGLADAARRALDETTNVPPGSVFQLTRFNRSKVHDDYEDGKDDYWMCEFDYESIGQYTDVCATFEQAVKTIRRDYFEEDGTEYPADDYHQFWNEITRYDLDENGELHEAISWVIGESGIIWSFDVYETKDDFTMRKRAHDCDEEFSLYYDVSLPAPFIPGDIITLDPRPFRPMFHAVVLENSGTGDCCALQVAFMNSKRRISNGAVSHWIIDLPHIHSPNLQFSPYYRLEKYDKALPEGEAVLRELSAAIKSHPEWNEVPGRNYIGDCLNAAMDRGNRRYGVEWEHLKSIMGEV